MSLRTTVRALPTMAKIGFAEAVAYRAEMLVWMLSTTIRTSPLRAHRSRKCRSHSGRSSSRGRQHVGCCGSMSSL